MKGNIDRDRHRSIHHKKNKKKEFRAKEDQILESYIPYDGDATKSPHILINKWYYRLRENCIILKNPQEDGKVKDR